MDDTEVIEGVPIVGVEGFTERMENGLECVVVPGDEKLPGDDVQVSYVPSGVNCFVVIGVAMVVGISTAFGVPSQQNP